MSNTILIKSSKRQCFTNEERRRIVDDFEKSGLGHNAFCKKMHINTNSLSIWKKKFGSKQSESRAVAVVDSLISTNLPESNMVSTLQAEVKRLTDEIYGIKQAFGNKLIEIEMQRMSHV